MKITVKGSRREPKHLHSEAVLGIRPDIIMVVVDKIALALSIIGSLNWGLVGIFRFDLVAWIFGSQAAVGSRIVYTLVALAGIWCISLLFRTEPAENVSDAKIGEYDRQTQ